MVLGLLISISYNLLQRRQIRDFVRQIRFRRKEKSQKQIYVNLPGQQTEDLAAEINELFREMQRTEIRYQEKEEEQRRMITNISHDIRTPLTSVSGYFQMLADTEDVQERERYMRIIRGRLQSLQELLEEFFTYVKIQNRKEEVAEELCDIRQILSESIFFFYDEIDGMQERDISLTEERLMVNGREEDLRRIFQNILKNAILHGNRKLRIRMNRAEQKAEIRIENETMEKLPENTEMVFERFYRADEARSTQSSGLGLSIVKELTEKMGGRAEAYLPSPHWFGICVTLPCKVWERGQEWGRDAGDTGHRG